MSNVDVNDFKLKTPQPLMDDDKIYDKIVWLDNVSSGFLQLAQLKTSMQTERPSFLLAEQS